MQHTAGKDKEMPYKVHILWLCLIKNYTKSISQTTAHKENKTCCVYSCNHRADTEYNRPAHYEIKHKGRLVPPLKIYGIKHNTQYGTKGIYTKKCPPQTAAYENKAHGYVASENQNKDGAMVKHPENPLGTLMSKGVIQSGKKIQGDEGCTIQRSTDNTYGSGMYARHNNGNNGSHNGKQCPHTVGNGIGNLLAKGLCPLYFRHKTTSFDNNIITSGNQYYITTPCLPCQDLSADPISLFSVK